MAVGRKTFAATACAFSLDVGSDNWIGFQNSKRDTGLTTWAVLRRSGFPISGEMDLEQLAKFLTFDPESFPECE